MSYFLKNEREADVYINEINKGDLLKLKEKAKVETNAKQRDRYRAVVLALEGWETGEIMCKLDRSKNFVQRWSYFYRDGGIEAISAKPQSGRRTKLPRQKEAKLAQRIQDGPTLRQLTDTRDSLEFPP